MINKLEADPKECIETLKMLNSEAGHKDMKEFDKIGRVKTRIVIEAEQSLNERAFRVNKVTRKNLGWSDTDWRERKDAVKKKGRKKDTFYWGKKRDHEEEVGNGLGYPKEAFEHNDSKEHREVEPNEAKSTKDSRHQSHDPTEHQSINKNNSINQKPTKSNLPAHMFAEPYVPEPKKNSSPSYHPYYNNIPQQMKNKGDNEHAINDSRTLENTATKIDEGSLTKK